MRETKKGENEKKWRNKENEKMRERGKQKNRNHMARNHTWISS